MNSEGYTVRKVLLQAGVIKLRSFHTLDYLRAALVGTRGENKAMGAHVSRRRSHVLLCFYT